MSETARLDRAAFFLKDFFRFFGEFFSGPVVGAFPQARVSKMIVVSPCETPEVT